MNTTYITGTDCWRHGENMRDSAGHDYLGPCPNDGRRTFDYGGGWACVNHDCRHSPEQLVCNNGPSPMWWNTEVQVKRDGDAWFAHGAGFINLQESACGFGATPVAAVLEFMAVVIPSELASQ